MKKRYSIAWVIAALIAVTALSTQAAGPKGPSIVDVAIDLNTDTNGAYYGVFDVLIEAVLEANPIVLATLDGNGQHTVFAPTDDAFEAAGITTNNVGDINKEFLTDVLLYHVVRGRRYADQILDSYHIRTRLRGFLLQDSGVLMDALGREAVIIVTDVEAANGIIHVIDAVLLPYSPPVP
jgi:uncharacterized surface protein with fasciclin (FAS1) repeats